MTKGSPHFKTIRAQVARTSSLPSHYTFSIFLLELLLEVIGLITREFRHLENRTFPCGEVCLFGFQIKYAGQLLFAE